MGVKGIDHWVIVSGNLERTLDFYTRLGFTIAWEHREGRPRMPTIRINDAQKINVHGSDWPERTGYHGARRPTVGGADFCLEWEGTVQEVLDLLRKCGVTPEAGTGHADVRPRAVDERVLPGSRRQPRGVHRVRSGALRGRGMNGRPKIVVAMMMHETNTFSPVPTPLASFRPLSGTAAIEEFRDTNTQLGGFLHVAQEMGAEITVPIAAGAHPSGYVERSAYEDMADAIVGAIRGGCDAAFLALHGAMVAEHLDDGEGELLRRIRAVAPRLPIAVGLDFHAHMTAPMVEHATVIAGYRTYPHVDMGETAQRAARTLARTLRGEVAPAMIWDSRPMMTSTLVHTPSRQPMKDVMDMAIAAEKSGAVLNASVFGGFPHADIPHISCSAVIVCDRRTDQGRPSSIGCSAWRGNEGKRFSTRARRSPARSPTPGRSAKAPSCWWTTATIPPRAARRT